MDAVHAEGTPIIAQLWHTGRIAHPDMDEQKKAGTPVYAPSAVKARGGKVGLIPVFTQTGAQSCSSGNSRANQGT